MARRTRKIRRRQQRWCLGLIWGAIAAFSFALLSPQPAIANEGGVVGLVQESFERIANSSQVPDLFSNADSPQTASVRLDGRTLFSVAAPSQRNGGQDGVSAQQRATEIEQRLQQVAERFLATDDPTSFGVSWRRGSDSNQPIIYISNNIDEDLVLMSVTSLDAEVQRIGIERRADQLVADIREGLQRYRSERQPEHLQQQLWTTVQLLAVVSLVSFGLVLLQHQTGRRRRVAEQDYAASHSPDATSIDLRERVTQQRRRSVLEAKLVTLQLIQVGLWGGSLFYLLWLFPQTRWIVPLVFSILHIPLQIALLILGICIAIRLTGLAVDSSFAVLQERSMLAPTSSQRVTLRFSTFSQVVKSIVTSTLIAIGILWALAMMGVNLAPILAGAGIVGLGISLASQSLVRDIINGFLVLFEDQYGVGDVVVIGEVAGFVETMNLRITQLRNEEGRLITIPNGHITVVQNLSKEWSRVDLQIPVALTANIDDALALVKHVAQEMTEDWQWKALILEPPLLLGVDHLDHVGAVIRLWMKTMPLKQWDVAREYRRRLKNAFDAADIPIGVPQQSIRVTPWPPVNPAVGPGVAASATPAATPTDAAPDPQQDLATDAVASHHHSRPHSNSALSK